MGAAGALPMSIRLLSKFSKRQLGQVSKDLALLLCTNATSSMLPCCPVTPLNTYNTSNKPLNLGQLLMLKANCLGVGARGLKTLPMHLIIKSSVMWSYEARTWP